MASRIVERKLQAMREAAITGRTISAAINRIPTIRMDSAIVTAASADGDDNDGDKLVDLNDPGCTSTTDTDETNPSVDLR